MAKQLTLTSHNSLTILLLALQTAAHPTSLVSRDVGNVYICPATNFSSMTTADGAVITCQVTTGATSACVNAPFLPIGSFGPDEGQVCSVYK
jgi:hypothetical protein